MDQDRPGAPMYVQHISGTGTKFKVYRMDTVHYKTFDGIWLPLSEYHSCVAPETWVNVTAHCKENGCGYVHHESSNPILAMTRSNVEVEYRIRRVHKDHISGVCFIIEKKVQG